MALIDPNNFLHSLARFVAAAAGGLAYVNTPRAIVRNVAVEDDAGSLAEPYTVLRIYGGPAQPSDPLQRWSVQFKTTGGDPEAVLARSQLLYGTLLDPASGLPLQMAIVPAYKAADDAADTPANYRLVGIDLLQRPGLIGVDARGRHESAWNVDLGVFQF